MAFEGWVILVFLAMGCLSRSVSYAYPGRSDENLSGLGSVYPSLASRSDDIPSATLRQAVEATRLGRRHIGDGFRDDGMTDLRLRHERSHLAVRSSPW